MTSRVIRNRGKYIDIVISCDQMQCDTAVNEKQISEGGGLREMGWEAAPADGTLRHYCPIHRRT